MMSDNEMIENFIDILIAEKVVRMSECQNHPMNRHLHLEANLLHSEINELKQQRKRLSGESPDFESVILTHEDISEIANTISLDITNVSQGELEWYICSWVKNHKAVDFFEEQRRLQEEDEAKSNRSN